MCWRCSAVSIAFFAAGAGAVCACVVSVGEQPQTKAANNAAPTAANAVGRLMRIFVLRQLGAMPPAAAKRLVQRRGIGETVGFRLHQSDPRLLITLLGVQEREIPAVPGLDL